MKEKYPRDSNMATNVTESMIKIITLDNQIMSLVEDQGFLHHLAIHYIDSAFELQHAAMHTSFVRLRQQRM